jgi:hypothetical protein
MKRDKKLGMEIPENDEERMWFNLKSKLEQESKEIEDSLKPKNRRLQLEKSRTLLKINKDLIKECEKHLK